MRWKGLWLSLKEFIIQTSQQDEMFNKYFDMSIFSKNNDSFTVHQGNEQILFEVVDKPMIEEESDSVYEPLLWKEVLLSNLSELEFEIQFEDIHGNTQQPIKHRYYEEINNMLFVLKDFDKIQQKIKSGAKND